MASTGTMTMSMRELERLKIVQAVVNGNLKPGQAAQRLGLTVRQVQRLVNRYRMQGAVGLVSDKRGRHSNHQLAPRLASQALTIIRDRYADFEPTLACEKLGECYGIRIGTETVRQLMMEAGLWIPRALRSPTIYQPRNRRHCIGELIQIDGSDQASVFRVNSKQARGGDGHTQFGRALYELNIESICANSSQAKGRVERANLTLQDRLVKELRLRNISTMEGANAYTPCFVDDFNRRFAKPPPETTGMHTGRCGKTKILRWSLLSVRSARSPMCSTCSTTRSCLIATTWPRRTAIRTAHATQTYVQAREKSNCLTRGLAALGVMRGTRVGVFLERSLDLPVLLLAILKAGGVFVPFDASTFEIWGSLARARHVRPNWRRRGYKQACVSSTRMGLPNARSARQSRISPRPGPIFCRWDKHCRDTGCICSIPTETWCRPASSARYA